MSKHAPTPYKLKGKSVNGKPHFNVIGTHLGCKYEICRVPFVITGFADLDSKLENEAKEDAKFIVKACNNHDRLVEALGKIVRTAPIGLGGWDALLEAKQLLTELKQQ